MTGKPERHIAALSLGGNVGDVAAAFVTALRAFEAQDHVRVTAKSNVWRTPPWGKTDQPDFLNMAVLIETSLDPQALLTICLSIERTAGRERHERWGPRPLDIDIISYDDIAIDMQDLAIPHPRAHERAFVLVPLAEIAGDIRLHGASVESLVQHADRTGMTCDKAASQFVRDM